MLRYTANLKMGEMRYFIREIRVLRGKGGSFELSGSCLDSRRDILAGGQGTVPEYDSVTKSQNCERDEGKKVEEYMEYTLKLF